jgi:hypothetical protein
VVGVENETASNHESAKEGIMSPKGKCNLAALLAVLLLGGASGAVSRAGDGACCPPPYVHCMEGPPCVHFKCVCPRPVCDPCNLEHWGYYPTCWRRWPGNWANCPGRSPPWVYNGPDYQIAEVTPGNTPQGMVPSGPTLTEPMQPVMPPPTQPMQMQPMQTIPEDAPSPREVPKLEQGQQQQPQYQGASPVSMIRPKLSLYSAPRGN